ncbi:MAG: hypothetical protein K8T89_23230 [Planctomycetes bacterium]|nr:hypothetical protein [Planctomycetota bacterium]
MKRLLNRVLFLVILVVVLMPGFVAAQCQGNQCTFPPSGKYVPTFPQPTVTPVDSTFQPNHLGGVLAGPQGVVSASPGMTWSDGFYRHESGRVEQWKGGKLIAHAKPDSPEWAALVKAMSITAKESFGLLPPEPPKKFSLARPSACVCKGECCCLDCPRECASFVAFAPEIDEPANYGMKWKPDGDEKHTLNGRMVHRNTFFENLAGRGGVGDIPDDSKVARLVVVGSDSARARVLADFAKLKAWQPKVIAQGYAPDNWAISKLYPAPADPTLYVVDADGLTRGCTPGYNCGIDGLECMLARADKLRDPSGVDPSKAPDLSKPEPPAPVSNPTPLPNPNAPAKPVDWTPILFVLGLMAAAYYARTKGKI